jgi:hypothetical protein
MQGQKPPGYLSDILQFFPGGVPFLQPKDLTGDMK